MPEVSGIARCGHCEASGAQHGCEHHGDVLVAVERCWAIRHPDARVGARGRPGPDFCLAPGVRIHGMADVHDGTARRTRHRAPSGRSSVHASARRSPELAYPSLGMGRPARARYPEGCLARARGRVRTRGARPHSLDVAAGRRSGGHKGEERFGRLELGGAHAPGVRDRCSGVPTLRGAAAADRDAARSRRHPEASRAPGDGPLRTESRSRPTRARRRHALIGASRASRTPSCCAERRLTASLVLIRPVTGRSA